MIGSMLLGAGAWVVILGDGADPAAVTLSAAHRAYDAGDFAEAERLLIAEPQALTTVEGLHLLGRALGVQAASLDFRQAKVRPAIERLAGRLIEAAERALEVRETAGGHALVVWGHSLLLDSGASPAFHARDIMSNTDRALEINPDFVPALIAKGDIYLRAPFFLGGSDEKARATFERAMVLSPDNPAPYLGMAKWALAQGSPVEAEKWAREAVARAAARSEWSGNRLRAGIFLQRLRAQ